jgi:NAD(P)-dependent dehydrogenase (short-subunit alcohol dehydrogenase family)
MINKVIFITGGTGLLGSEVVDRLLRDGFDVISTTTSDEKVCDCVKYGQRLKIIKINFMNSDFEQIIIELFQKSNIYAIINNARSFEYLKTNSNGFCSAEDLQNEFYMNVIVPYRLALLAFEFNKVLEIIINISSQYARRVPNPYLYNAKSEISPIQYNVSKAALNKITKELAVRFFEKKIRVNCIEYGGIEGRASNSFVEKYNSRSPHGKMLKLNECYGPIKTLLDPDNCSINGAVIVANSGWTLC